jgi:hypothetical protein
VQGSTEQHPTLSATIYYLHRFSRGSSAPQLSQRHTLDDVPLGDQQYGNCNGLSPQRAIVSED